MTRKSAVAVPQYVPMAVLQQDKGQGTSLYAHCVLLSANALARFVLADTSQLHNKISEMGQRIRQLEDALAIFQAGVSTEVHPLLREDLLAIKFGPDATQTAETEKRTKDPIIDSIDALGTLTIGDRGEGKYFGRSAGSEVSYPVFICLSLNLCQTLFLVYTTTNDLFDVLIRFPRLALNWR